MSVAAVWTVASYLFITPTCLQAWTVEGEQASVKEVVVPPLHTTREKGARAQDTKQERDAS